MSKRLLPVLIATALLLAGCEETTESNPAPRDFGKPSGVERVPVPSEAKRIDSFIDDATFEVPGYSYDELRDWYAREMPDGIDWYRWQWCDIGGGPGVGESLIYSQPPRRILAVAIVKDTTPGIIIGTDNSGPC